MRAALLRYRIAEYRGGLPVVARAPQPGDVDPAVAALVARLRAEGDPQLETLNGQVYDSAVQAAVQRFQLRHGLTASGMVDAPTLAALNEPIEARIDKIRVNMERLRWLPQQPAATRLVVNIASFQARLYRDDALLLVEPVVVGTPFRQTPEFSDRIQYLVVNPSWDVPSLIAGQDILPKLQADPSYLDANNFEVLQGWGAAERAVDPGSVDWKSWTADNLPYRLRQKPGAANPLGRIKFMFPNRYGVYLHDTPAQGLFSEGQRTFSSGCIRVAHALDLAAAILTLDGRTDSRQFLQAALAGDATLQIPLSRPLPIYIVYFTTWVETDGSLDFRSDVYDRDADILRTLDTPFDGAPPPGADPAESAR